jgi:tripeptide aminopeptidase
MLTLDEHCYVYAWMPGNTKKRCQTVGFIAHMDTAPDFSGTDVQPRVIEKL